MRSSLMARLKQQHSMGDRRSRILGNRNKMHEKDEQKYSSPFIKVRFIAQCFFTCWILPYKIIETL